MALQAKSVARVHRFRQILPKAAEEVVLLTSARFLQIAVSSASETEYLVFLARDLKYLNANQYVELLDAIIEVRKMLTSLLQRLKTEN